MHTVYIVLSAALLAGCASREAREAEWGVKDDAQCQSYGARPGDPAYVNCRTQLSAARTTARAIDSSGGPTTCTRFGANTVCN